MSRRRDYILWSIPAVMLAVILLGAVQASQPVGKASPICDFTFCLPGGWCYPINLCPDRPKRVEVIPCH